MKSFKFSRKIFYSLLILIISFFTTSCREKVPKTTCMLITDGTNLLDHSYNEKAWNGVLSFYHDSWGEEAYFGTLYDAAPCSDIGLAYSTIKKVTERKPDLIIINSFTMIESLALIAPVYPDQKYLMIDDYAGDFSNVLNIFFATEEGSFLVGLAAALQAKEDGLANPSFGFIGGILFDTILDFEAGYIQGIHEVFPNAKIYDYYVNAWDVPKIAAEKAKEWYDKNIYAIYSAAGASGNGTIAQAVAHRKNGKNVWAIGVDSDQINEGSYGAGKSAVLTSMLKNADRAVLFGLNLVERNTFVSGTKILGLKNDGVNYTISNPELKESVQKKLEEYKTEIISENRHILSARNDKDKVNELLSKVIHE